MSFFIAKNEGPMDTVFDPAELMAKRPEYYGPRFDAIADMRKLDDGTLHKGSEFRRVASFVNVPLFGMTTKLFDPDFMKDKKKFYAFLDRHREYCTYDRRWQGGEQTKVKTPKIMNLADMGLAYEGSPESAVEFEPVYLESAEATA